MGGIVLTVRESKHNERDYEGTNPDEDRERR